MRRTVIDPHIHLWDLRGTPRRQTPIIKLFGWSPGFVMWLGPKVFPSDVIDFFGRPDQVLSDYLTEHYALDTASWTVQGVVHVEAGWEGKGPLGPVGETRWVEEIADPWLLGIVGRADLSLGVQVDEVLRAHLDASPRFRGVRYSLANHPSKQAMDYADAGVSRDPQWREGYARLAEHDLSFDAFVFQQQLDEIAELARDFPDVPIILCHVGTPPGFAGPFGGLGETPAERDRIAGEWREGMQRVAEHDNVFAKVSGIGMPVVGWGYHEREEQPSVGELVDDFGPIVDFVVETFGAERCMFASNFPVDKVSYAWTTLFDAFSEIVADRSEAEQRALFAETARRVYRL